MDCIKFCEDAVTAKPKAVNFSPTIPNNTRNETVQRMKVNGKWAKKFSFPLDVTGKKPVKHVKQKYSEGSINDNVTQRREGCTGFQVHRIPQTSQSKDTKATCIDCGSKTRYFCIGCHHPFCGEVGSNNKKREGNKDYFHVYKDKNGNEQIACYKGTFFVKGHEKAWCKYFKQQGLDSNESV